MTFDDGSKSDFTVVAPLLKSYGFGATFYISEGLHFDNKTASLTWEEIKALSDTGFEIGNHTRSHPNMATLSREQIIAEVAQIETRFKAHGIPAPRTFCYPGYHNSPEVLKVLGEKGYLFARRGVAPEFPYSDKGDRGPAYDPQEDHPLLVPTTGASGPNWGWEDFRWAIEQAKDGKICVLTFHGVPTGLYPHASTKPEDFARYMKHLHDNDYMVIAMRDLAKYVDPARSAADPYQAIFKRLGVKPVQLKCEYAVNPVGIDAAEPRFSWLLESTRRDQTQAAYQILVAGSEEKLEQGIGDLWDSGKVVSSRSVNVPYQGRALTSGQKCWWKVRCWNKPGYDGEYARAPYHDPRTIQAMREQRPSTYSGSATFDMGLLKPSDWQGKWVGAGKEISSPLLRKAFTLDTPVKRATVHVCGLGYYELYINGEKVGDHVLDPGTTYYHNDHRQLPPEIRTQGRTQITLRRTRWICHGAEPGLWRARCDDPDAGARPLVEAGGRTPDTSQFDGIPQCRCFFLRKTKSFRLPERVLSLMPLWAKASNRSWRWVGA
ncbi:MAG: polysaccharide deacetylase family protein [Verrucomicrobia bacterium]|nr:polysaccharide deacetylase family protein [Verrucomicrobiota bacterium]